MASKRETVFARLLDQTDISDKVKVLWACDYDGLPLSGLCLFEEVVCWFDCVDEVAYRQKTIRVYHVYRLTEEERKAELRRHESFMDNIGTHQNYVDNKRLPNKGNRKPDRYHHNHLSRYPERNRQGVYDDNEVLGAFTDLILKRNPMY